MTSSFVLTCKGMIARAICRPWVGALLARLFRDRIPHRGCTINTDWPSVAPSTKASLYWGFYESAETRFVQQFLRPDLDVVELGSSLGVVASHIARKMRADRKLVCVEANPGLLEAIAHNVRLNRPECNVEVIHGAISYSKDAPDVVRFTCEPDHTTSSLAPSAAGEHVVEVPAVTLATVLERTRLTQFALVCDIEGAEAGLIERDQASLAQCAQLVLELHESNWEGETISVEQLVQKLTRDHGLTLRERHGPVCVFDRATTSSAG